MAGRGLAALPSNGTLSNYTPTLRERMADALRRTFYSDDLAGQQQAEKVLNFGEAVTPLGTLTGAYDAGRDAGQGSYGGAALNLGMALLPGPNPKMNPEFSAILKAASERKTLAADLAKNNTSLKMLHSDGRSAMVGPDMSKPGIFRFTRFDNAGPVGHTEHQSLEEAINEALREHYTVKPDLKPKGIRAYHGSPHDFDRFDMSKIGTGEGAQAYGHGLYFAENEGIARSYRDQLKPGTNNSIIHIGPREFGSDMGNYYLRQDMERALPLDKTRFVSGKETYDHYNKELGDAAYLALRKANPTDDPVKIMADAMDAKIAKLQPYEDELPSVLAIKDAALNYAKDNIRLKPNGHMYEVDINADPNTFLDWDKPLSEQPEAVRQAIPNVAAAAPPPKAGPAIRNRQSILAGDNVPGDVIWNNLGGFSSPDDARKAWNAAGIPGLKYLDAGSRTKGDGSRNYVVFDDKLINIVRKYGLAALLPAGALAAGASQDQGGYQ